ncbi:TIGR00645 family protein [Candidatus Methylomicrobium oryzae]|jgi:uncharacterized protein (TIGR00645 family)|uniref:TIGR00645 family protein n=1 Tax=Candidatus Methylomicrobium oryzae TaxID=2802053 RepID=UPI001921552F|nr:TIGR00645 family protein [Methylomicrobium sp. RS1]MBL1263775.1 TIGR00645 family protein [Methylomicrobium sp. RS1]
MSLKEKTEHSLERIMYGSRWILAPVYVGMSLVVAALFIKFFQELYHFLPHLLEMNEADLILKVLALIDLTMVGSLIVIVMFSGYENFVSRLDIAEDAEKLDWLGTHDYGSLKMKIASTIVAISSIHLLKIFMKIEDTHNEKILWYVAVHLTLVVSALLMSVQDKLSKH